MPRRRTQDEHGGAMQARPGSGGEARRWCPAGAPESCGRGQAVKPMSSYWRSKKPRAPTLASVSRTATICGRW